MNYSTAIFLVNKAVMALKTAYEPESDPPTATEISKRRIFKTFDKTLKVGDLVVVPTNTRQKFTIVKVVETNVTVDIEHAGQVDWVAGPLDVAAYEHVLKQEEVMISTIKEAEANHRRDELHKKLLANVDPSAINKLQIANMTTVPDAKVIGN